MSRKSEIFTRNFETAIKEITSKNVYLDAELDPGIKSALKKEENVILMINMVPPATLNKNLSLVETLAMIGWPDFSISNQVQFLEYLFQVVQFASFTSSDFDQSAYQKVLISLCKSLIKPATTRPPSDPSYQTLREGVAQKCGHVVQRIFVETNGGDRALQALSRTWNFQLWASVPPAGAEDYLNLVLSLYPCGTDAQRINILGLYLQKLGDFEVAETPTPTHKERKTTLLDTMYFCLFQFFDKHCSVQRRAGEVQGTDKDALETVFRSTLEPICTVLVSRLEDTKFLQYVVMYFIGLDGSLKDVLLKELEKRASEPSKDKSNERCGFLMAVLGAFTEVKTMLFLRYIRKVLKWMKSYSSRISPKSKGSPSFGSHLAYYNVAQGLFKAISMRRHGLVATVEARVAVSELSHVMDELIYGYLNPLRYVAPSVAAEFVPVAIEIGIAQPGVRYEDVKRDIIPVAGFIVEALPLMNSFEEQFTFPRSSKFISVQLCPEPQQIIQMQKRAMEMSE